ncbi:MAG: YkgJ family cysteine cluster protein [Wenzhouxiangellaceae bacterium]|nr:YkgJ family cysteine cluster protein [Wenzhouxiangellaceae bacterium]
MSQRAEAEASASLRRGDAARALRLVQRLVESETAGLPRAHRGPLACRAGCDFCCHLRVMATALEVFALLDFAEREFEPDALTRFKSRVAETEQALRELAPDRVLAVNLRCPLLGEDGRCTAYSARPLNCRSYHSLSREACEKSFRAPEDPTLGHPQLTALAELHAGSQGGLIAALRGAGRDERQYELVTALAEAIRDPESRRRFEAGQRAFLDPLPIE